MSPKKTGHDPCAIDVPEIVTLFPWQHGSLKDWTIVGMNHYHVDGDRRIFVAMVKGDRCIKEEGLDSGLIWRRLEHKAGPESPSDS